MLRKSARYRSFYLAVAAGTVVALATWLIAPAQAVLWGSNTFFALYLALNLTSFPRASAEFLQRHADQEDAPPWAIFIVTIAVIAASLVSLFQLVASDRAGALQLTATAISVALGWLTVHCMAAHHYAYEYYAAGKDGKGKRGLTGGLDFPSGKQPDGMGFLYFAYVIGMTAQVADVSITSREMQRLVLLHGIFSFFFNTVIVAATVNIVVSL